MKNNKTSVFLISFFIVLGIAFIWYSINLINEKKVVTLPVLGNPGHRVGSFSFTNQDGKTVTQDDVKGKIYVAEFFFATCRGICPKMNENMSKVYQAFRGSKEVMILSHTVDPKKDTVAALKAYSLKFDADARQWMFLTGPKKELYDMARFSYLVTAADDTAVVDIKSDFIHTQYWVLVDGDGLLRGKFYDGTNIDDVNTLIGDIKILLEEKNRAKH